MSEGLRPHAPYTPTQAELLDEAEKEIERLCGKVRTLERGLSEAKATISEQARDCIQARRELAEARGLLVDARAEVMAQADFHGCDNCNLTSTGVVARIDAALGSVDQENTQPACANPAKPEPPSRDSLALLARVQREAYAMEAMPGEDDQRTAAVLREVEALLAGRPAPAPLVSSPSQGDVEPWGHLYYFNDPLNRLTVSPDFPHGRTVLGTQPLYTKRSEHPIFPPARKTEVPQQDTSEAKP